MNIKYKKMPLGLKDISNYLGIKDDKAIFYHSLSFDVNDKNRRSDNTSSMIYSEIFSFACNDGPKFASCYYNDKLIDYLNENGIINKDNLVLLGKDKKINYPYNSVSKMLKKEIEINSDLRKKLDGYTVVSSYLSSDDEEIAKLINGKTLMDVDSQIKFNSKYFMRVISDKYNFSVPFGMAFCGVLKLEEILDVMIANNVKKAWLKLEELVSGAGNIYIDNLENKEEIKTKLMELANKYYGKIFDKKYINEEIRIIIEEDLSDKEISNIGIQAVISDDEITILGGVAQKTEDGVYRGSYLDEEVYKHVKKAEKVAEKFFYAYQQEGYRGCITVDVIVTEDNAYNIDPNARFSAGSMLLKNIHASEYYSGKKMYGLSFTNAIPAKNNLINDLFDYIGDNLYRGAESDYEGIIPALLNDVNPLFENKYYLKSIVIADSYAKADKMYKEFKDNIKKSLMEVK